MSVKRTDSGYYVMDREGFVVAYAATWQEVQDILEAQ